MSPKIPFAPHSSFPGQEGFVDGFPGEAYPERQNGQDEERSDGNTMLSNHKGKLAVGAAAMLGLAIYYKWREHLLAKEDPEDYRRIRRIKAIVETDRPRSGEKL